MGYETGTEFQLKGQRGINLSLRKKIITLGSRQKSLSYSCLLFTNHATCQPSDIMAYPTPTAVPKHTSANPSGYPVTHPVTNPSSKSSPDQAFLTQKPRKNSVGVKITSRISFLSFTPRPGYFFQFKDRFVLILLPTFQAKIANFLFKDSLFCDQRMLQNQARSLIIFRCCCWVIRLYASNCAVKLFVLGHLLTKRSLFIWTPPC